MLEELMAHWPEGVPPHSRMVLHVQADRAELWRMWAEARSPHPGQRARGPVLRRDLPRETHGRGHKRPGNGRPYHRQNRICRGGLAGQRPHLPLRRSPGQARDTQIPGPAPFLWAVASRDDDLPQPAGQLLPEAHRYLLEARAGRGRRDLGQPRHGMMNSDGGN